MGCDIHEHVEYKSAESSNWQHFCQPHIWRNYDLFALLAGVRNYDEIVPVAEPRGIPKDSSFDTVMEYTGGMGHNWREIEWVMDYDWHTPSWLTLTELKQVRQLLKRRSVELDGVIGMMEGLSNGGEVETRFIFWFDN